MGKSDHRDARVVVALIIISLSIFAILFFIAFTFSMSSAKSDVPAFLSVDSPDLEYYANVYLISSDKMEGSSLSVSIFDKNDRLLRKDIYRQWYCVHISIHWKTDGDLIINGLTLNPKIDSIEFKTKSTDFCPESSLIY